MKKLQLLVRLGQILAMTSLMWIGPLPTAIAQDLNVNGNTCTGDTGACASETFDATVDLKLKSISPGIRFEDTTPAGAGALTTDWRLTANNGGNKLSVEEVDGNKIPFTIEAGAPDNALYINSFGNLGIGTSTPAADVHIRSGGAPVVLLEQDASSGAPYAWAIFGDNFSYRIQDVSAVRVPFAIGPGAPTSSFIIAPNGNIGFRTNAPEAGLHINGGVSSDVFSGIGPDPAGDSGQSAFNFGYSGASFQRGSGFFNARPDPGAVAPNPSVRFMTQNLQRMIIAHNGNVGIGQFGAVVGSSPGTTPLSRLHVQGDVRVEGGSFIDDGVTLNVPDYVFAPDYKLMSLTDLQAYIEKERHLPDIPSGQEIKEQGVKLGEMQLQLLKKVEELTLYTIQQDKKFTTLQGQNQKLAAENAQLQARLSAIEAVVEKLGQR